MRHQLFGSGPWANTVYLSFKSKLIMPMKRGQAQFAMTRLHIYLAPIMLRRTKETVIDGKPILNLPPKTIEVVKTDFYDEDEREFYRSIAEKMTKIVNKFVRAGTVMNNYTSMLVAILRMRQACNHPHLSKRRADSYWHIIDMHIDSYERNCASGQGRHCDNTAAQSGRPR